MFVPEGPESDFLEAFFAWAEAESAKVLATGSGLDPEELRLAHDVDVPQPGRIRTLGVAGTLSHDSDDAHKLPRRSYHLLNGVKR